VKARIEKILLDFGTSNGGTCSEEEIGLLANYLSRFTAGLGIVEVLMSDPRVQDIYVDSPCGETPVYINHRDFQECETNIYMTEEELEALVSKLRLVSGRPFSEANPVLDAETGGTRITVVGPPLSMDGIALAIRRHKPTPWTLPQLVRNRFLSPLAAGLLSLLVDGRTTILITGSRGAGKTSLLGALMTEVLPRYRIITIEDTPELPVKHLKRAGFKIESLYSRSVVSGSGLELGTDDALRTALRLGDSVLVVGEVRGPEARILYEAMRVGAAGNTVMGTIHGSSARDVFERVVFDLGVPPVSFKSTDVILTVAPLQLRGALTRSRRLVQVVEVRKTWRERTDPALHKLMEHETSSDRLKNLGLRDSEVLKQIARRWGVGEREVLQNVELRAKVCSELVRTSVKRDNSRILELEFVVRSNLAWRSLLYSRELRMISYQRVFSKWKRWLSDAVADLEASDG
jgi:type IV secretory pathway ATPase VirB11/archaellum biosynthesis ATPase